MLVLSAGTLTGLDWAILVVYLAVVLAIGIFAGAGAKRSEDYFLAGRSMPMWAVALSLFATSLSAATFIGVPQRGYVSNLTYLFANVGHLIAAVVVALLFIPRFYRMGVTSIYQLVGGSFGPTARRTTSATFLVGRMFASGARLFVVAIPFTWVAFGPDPGALQLVFTIIVIGVAATAYTLIGGMRAVIFTDVLQAIVLTAAAVAAVIVLFQKIGMEPGELIRRLAEPGPDAPSKLQVISLSTNPGEAFTLWTTLTGLTLLNLAALGTDQDLTQRLLTCRTARAGSWSVVLANLISWPVIGLFLVVGLLLFVFYDQSDAGDAGDSRDIFVRFMFQEMPGGLRGLMMAGLSAAAMSSMDSALNAMSAATVTDFYRPWRDRREGLTTAARARDMFASKVAVVVWAVALTAVACVCVYWHRATDLPLVDFALMIMAFAYSGLLAVFLTALCTRRGNAISVIAGLATGFASMLSMNLIDDWPLAFPWQMVIATGLSFLVCLCGRRP